MSDLIKSAMLQVYGDADGVRLYAVACDAGFSVADGPSFITIKGKKYSSTGKTGKRTSNGKQAAEYEEIDNEGRATGHRVWREEDSGAVYADSAVTDSAPVALDTMAEQINSLGQEAKRLIERMDLRDDAGDFRSRWSTQWTDAEVKAAYEKYKNGSKPDNWSDIKNEYEKRIREMNRMGTRGDAPIRHNRLTNNEEVAYTQLKRRKAAGEELSEKDTKRLADLDWKKNS